MATNLLTYSTHYPTLQELSFAVDCTGKQYGEAAYQCERAWELYNQAVDDRAPDVEMLGVMAEHLEAVMYEAGQLWQDAKKNLLTKWN